MDITFNSIFSHKAQSSTSVEEAFVALEESSKQLSKATVPLLPLMALIISIVGLVAEDPMYASALAAVALAFLICKNVFLRFPKMLRTLWSQGVIGQHGSRYSSDVVKRPSKDFIGFLDRSTELFHHRGQWWLVGILVILAISWRILFAHAHQDTGANIFLVKPYTDLFEDANVFLNYGIGVTAFAFECILGVFVGLLVWRLCIIGMQLWRLSDVFELTPHFSHPDQCGGLKPLGDTCLWIAFIIAVPGVYLAVWMLIGPTLYDYRYGDLYLVLHTWILAIPVALAVFIFFAPLWRVHLAMARCKSIATSNANELIRLADENVEQLFQVKNKVSVAQAEKIAQQTNALHNLYQNYQHYPVWPFDTKIAIRFGASQVLQLLSLAGFSEQVQGVFKATIDLFVGG